MTKPKGSFALILLAAVAIPAASLFGQSYGDQNQVLTIGAAAFQIEDATDGDGGYIDEDGYIYAPGTPVHWAAPIYLPDGAVIHQVCAYVNQTDSDHVELISVVEEELAPGGASPFRHGVAGMFTTAGLGYGYYCSNPEYFRTRNNADANGDGTVSPIEYWVEVSANIHLGFGGALVTWSRVVSPPPSSRDSDGESV